MPQKHSKNNTDGAVFTHHERRLAGYGTQKQRLGTDSQNPFGYCCLSLKPVVDPVVRCLSGVLPCAVRRLRAEGQATHQAPVEPD